MPSHAWLCQHDGELASSLHAPGSERAGGVQWGRWLEALLGSRALSDCSVPVPLEGPLFPPSVLQPVPLARVPSVVLISKPCVFMQTCLHWQMLL